MTTRARTADLILPAAVIAIVAMMMFPLPSGVLDVLLICNITFSLLLLLSAVYLSEPERFTALPTVLLLSTLFRLGLNISTTRQLLGTGHAPATVVTFGNFLASGNLLVGGVLFAIITLVQFLVIAKGSERVAEVAARFTLDAMPGKQMSIDADIRSGLLSVIEAKQKRLALQRESKLYGALDGAMKFVKGDAVAGLCIAVVNSVGGLIIGITQHNMTAGEALARYTLYTIGDGLVSQIPALLVAVAAGVAVTRVGDEESTFVGREVFSQMAKEPQALGAAACVTGAMGCVPGLPGMPFFALTIGLGILSLHQRQRQTEGDRQSSEFEFRPRLYSDLLLRLSPEAVLALQQSGKFAEQVQNVRAQMFEQLGLWIPDIQFEISGSQNAAGAALEFRGATVTQLHLIAGGDFPAQLLHALAEQLVQLRCELCDDAATRQLLEVHRSTCEELINSLIPEVISVTELTGALRQLVREQVSIRDMRAILQAVAEHFVAVDRGLIADNELVDRLVVTHEVLRGATASRNEARKGTAVELLASMRVALRRTISKLVCGQSEIARCWLLDSEFDLLLSQAEAAGLPSDPAISAAISASVLEQAIDAVPVIIASRFARMRVVRSLAAMRVASHVIAVDELMSNIQVEILGIIGKSPADDQRSGFDQPELSYDAALLS